MWIDAITELIHSPWQWCHNERDGVLHHRRLVCLLNRLSRGRSNKTSKLRFTGLCDGFPSKRTSNTENVSILWRYHARSTFILVKACHLGAKVLPEPISTQCELYPWNKLQCTVNQYTIICIQENAFEKSFCSSPIVLNIALNLTHSTYTPLHHSLLFCLIGWYPGMFQRPAQIWVWQPEAKRTFHCIALFAYVLIGIIPLLFAPHQGG